MSSLITIGPGKDYDGVDAIYNACSSFSTLAGEGVVTLELYPGYVYDAGIILNQTGVDASNYFHIKPAAAYYYPGDLTNKIALKMKSRGGLWTSTWGGIGGFWLFSGYHKFESFKWLCADGDGAFGIGFLDYTAGSGVVVGVDIFDVCMDNSMSGSSPNNYGIMCVLYDPSSSVTIKNSIQYYANVNSITSMSTTLSSQSMNIYNSLVVNRINRTWSGATIVMKNTGYILTGSDLSSGPTVSGETSLTGSNNYDNHLTAGHVDFGSNHLNISINSMSFVDTTNKNFSLKLQSVLIGSGVYDSNNPTNAQRSIWINNHRSPFESPVLVDTATPAPRYCDKIYGCYEDDMLLAIPFTENPYDATGLYESSSVSIYGAYVWADTIYGSNRFNDLNYDSTDKYLLTTESKEKLTFIINFKKESGAGLRSLLTAIGSGVSLIIEYNPNTDYVYFTIGSWSGNVNVLLNSDVSKWTQFQFVLDLTKSTDAERLIIYSNCCGGRNKETVNFTGTAPSVVPSFNYVEIGDCPGIYGALYVYDNVIPDFILEDIADDPYIPFRDPLDLMGLAQGGFLTNLLQAIWFLRKFIMGQ